jgi:hypothetical protein
MSWIALAVYTGLYIASTVVCLLAFSMSSLYSRALLYSVPKFGFVCSRVQCTATADPTADLREHGTTHCPKLVDSLDRAYPKLLSSLVSAFRALLRPPASKTPLSLSQETAMTTQIALPARVQSLGEMWTHGATKSDVKCIE